MSAAEHHGPAPDLVNGMEAGMHRDGRAINAPHPLHIVNDEIAANNGAYVIVTERDRWYFEKASRPIAVSPLLA